MLARDWAELKKCWSVIGWPWQRWRARRPRTPWRPRSTADRPRHVTWGGRCWNAEGNRVRAGNVPRWSSANRYLKINFRKCVENEKIWKLLELPKFEKHRRNESWKSTGKLKINRQLKIIWKFGEMKITGNLKFNGRFKNQRKVESKRHSELTSSGSIIPHCIASLWTRSHGNTLSFFQLKSKIRNRDSTC